MKPTIFAAALVLAALGVLAAPAFAASEQVLYSFCSGFGCPDGTNPFFAGVIFDASGNLYGTASAGGGASGAGTVFELSPGPNGWTETTLYSFCSAPSCQDGSVPYGGLVFDGAGNLYGTTYGGGAFDQGTVFELSPGPDGSWSESVLHSFNYKTTDGAMPESTLVFNSGSLFGTTSEGGIYGYGIVFELTPGALGWNETVLWSFGSPATKGPSVPTPGPLTFDSPFNIYGTTYEGGAAGNGTVYRLQLVENSWVMTTLHSFLGGHDGINPEGGVIVDAAGNLYGTTGSGGGTQLAGIVFELIPHKYGIWKEKILHVFNPKKKDGVAPDSTLIFDAAGNLYGTTVSGPGSNCDTAGCGTVFELTPGPSGKWTETLLHIFDTNQDGETPSGGLILDAAGNLYGTTNLGGADNDGTVFEVTP